MLCVFIGVRRGRRCFGPWDAKRFASGKQVGAHAGLVPRQYQSGMTDRQGRITRRGPGVLRKLPAE
ncbi:transposase [Zavarzinella formosa]|uniref:transposase n=1 Tax=Zavarzinella formosa TaxID=360055 RepID=UPI0002ED93C5